MSLRLVRSAAAVVLTAGVLSAVVTVLGDHNDPVTTVAAGARRTDAPPRKPARTPSTTATIATTTSAVPTTVTPVTEPPVVVPPTPTTRVRPTTTTTEPAPPPEPVVTEPPPPPPPPPVENVVLAAAEQTIVTLVNSVRAASGVGPLSVSGHITGVARQWAQHMAGTGALNHNPAYFDQILAGVDCRTAAENVAFRRPGDAAAIHGQFMNSPGHAANVLDPAFTSVGIGVVVSPDGTMWVVQNFCG